MSGTATIILENLSFIAIFALCLYGTLLCRKHTETVPSVSILMVGFLVYAAYGMLGWAAAGFTGSFITDYSRTGVLNAVTFKSFLAHGLRLGLILMIVGIFRVARELKV